jgi:ferredoxin
MAYEITDNCVKCTACELVCPNAAISEAETLFVIDPLACTECADAYPVAQCSSICPIEGAIVDELGDPINPPGSLTGIILLATA